MPRARVLRIAFVSLVTALSLGVVATALRLSGVWRGAVWTDGRGLEAGASSVTPRDVIWCEPAPIPTDAGAGVDVYEPRLSWDGNRLFFTANRPGDAETPASIRVIDRTPEGWSEPMAFEEFGTTWNVIGAEPTRDDRAIYFASDREGGYGGFDLWVIRRDDAGAWREAVNLGPSINSAFDEYSPTTTPEGDRLFFASNRPTPESPVTASAPPWEATVRENIERNGFDLYEAPVFGDVAGDAAPIDAVNTGANEGTPCVSPFGDFLYFASDRPGGAGGFDLYRVRLRLGGGFDKAERCSDQLNSPFNDLDPALGMGGHEIVFSSDRPVEGAAFDGVSRLLTSTAREVYLKAQPMDASMGWVWWLLWLLMLLLLLILLLYLLRRLTGMEWSGKMRKLGLLAQCLLLSLLIHALLMLALTVWQVSAAVGDALRGSGATRVSLTTSAGSQTSGLTSQLMSAAASVDIETPTPESLRPVPVAIETPGIDRRRPVSNAVEVETDRAPLRLKPTEAAMAAPPEMARRQMQPGAAPARAEPMVSSSIATPEAESPRLDNETPVEIAAAKPEPARAAISAVPRIESRAAEHQMGVPVDASVTAIEPDAAPLVMPGFTPAEIDAAPIERTIAASPAPEPVVRLAPTDVRLPQEEQASSNAAEPELRIETHAVPERAMRRDPIELAPSVAQSGAPLRTPIEIETPREDRPLVLESGAGEPIEPALDVPGLDPGQRLPEALPEFAAVDVRLPGSGLMPDDSDALEPGALVINAELTRSAARQTATFHLDDPAPRRVDSVALDAELTRPDAELAPSRAPTIESMATPELSRPLASLHIPTDTPPRNLALPELEIPTETAPPADAYAQRDESVRENVVEAMGGSKETERAVALAMDWLARHQSADGRWDSDGFDTTGRLNGRSRVDCDVAVTGLALLVFLGADQTHTEDGPYREHVEKGLRWLLSRQSRGGDLRNGETMYTQGIAAIALCEAYGMTGDARLREPAQRAISFIIEAQGPDSGWRYDPGMAGDTSVLGWQVMAMISARKVGLEAPQAALDGAGAWLDSVSRPNTRGLYSYQRHKAPSYSMTAEGMFVQQLLGVDRASPRMAQSAQFIARQRPDWSNASNTYGWYYATLALFQHQGPEWERWNESIAAVLVGAQRQDGDASGSWDTDDQWSRVGGRVYQTAICALTLEVYYRYLPLYLTRAPEEQAQEVPRGGE
ncbi:MAG: PD40 domain-containing protein [Phycisphaeraceae bacterium]|nr:PD40 domain-containing protein [Phycisphaeraceae bacterium]